MAFYLQPHGAVFVIVLCFAIGIVAVTTSSGQGMTTPHGSVTASYGSFGTSNLDLNFGYGGKK